MIVRCDTCQTEFSVDDSVIGDSGATVRCSVCAYVFHVAAVDERDVAPLPWQLRTGDGRLLIAHDLARVVAWLREGVISGDAEMTRTGRRWTKVADMPELAQVLLSRPAADPGKAESAQAPRRDRAHAMLGISAPKPGGGHEASTRRLSAGRALGPLRPKPAQEPAAGVPTDAEASSASSFRVVEDRVRERRRHRGLGPEPEEVDPGTPVPKTEAVEGLRQPELPPPPVLEGPIKVNRRHRSPPEDLDASMGLDAAVETAVDALLDGPQAESQPAPSSAPQFEIPADVQSLMATTIVAPTQRGDLDADPNSESENENVATAPVDPSALRPRAAVRTRPKKQWWRTRVSSGPRLGARLRAGGRILAVAGVVVCLLVPIAALVAVKVPAARAKLPMMAGLAARISLFAETERPAPPEEFFRALTVVAGLSAQTMESTITEIAGTLDRGVVGRYARADLSIALAELYATRAMTWSMVAAIDPGTRAVSAGKAELDLSAAQRAMAAAGSGPELHRRHHRVRALLALVEGRPRNEVRQLVPDWDSESSTQIEALADITRQWRSPHAEVLGHTPTLPTEAAEVGLMHAARLMIDLRPLYAPALAADDPTRTTERVNAARARLDATLASTPDHIVGSAIAARISEVEARKPDVELDQAAPVAVDATPAAVPVLSAGPEIVDRTMARTRVVSGLRFEGGRAERPRDYRAAHAKTVSRGQKAPSYTKLKDPIARACQQVEDGDVDGGLAKLIELRETQPRHATVLQCLARAHARAGNLRQALASYERVLAINDRAAPALLGAARAAASMGDHEMARGFYERLVRVVPGHPAAVAYLDAHPE